MLYSRFSQSILAAGLLLIAVTPAAQDSMRMSNGSSLEGRVCTQFQWF